MVLPGDSWNYIVPTQQLPTEWTNISYNDNGWGTGDSGFGYSDGDDATIINTTLALVLMSD